MALDNCNADVGVFYVVYNRKDGTFKVGMTTRRMEQRKRELENSDKCTYDIVFKRYCDDIRRYEHTVKLFLNGPLKKGHAKERLSLDDKTINDLRMAISFLSSMICGSIEHDEWDLGGIEIDMIKADDVIAQYEVEGEARLTEEADNNG